MKWLTVPRARWSFAIDAMSSDRIDYHPQRIKPA